MKSMQSSYLTQEYTHLSLLPINLEVKRHARLSNLLMRLFDIIFSSVALILYSPIMVVMCVIISLETPGSPIYIQTRVGLHGRYFNLYKLRSMYLDAEKDGAKWADKNDSRITRVGAFIRKTRIDEFPQFINVLRGDMSVIGPRPERAIFITQFCETTPAFINRLLVKPGITGLAQINGGYDLTPEEKLAKDLYYIENQSFYLNMKILAKTVYVVFTGEGAR